VRLFTRRGYDWTDRYPAIVAAAAKLGVKSFTLDGEAGARPLRGSAALQEVAEHRQDNERRLAHQAHLLRRVYRGPDDQSRPRAFHGQADGCEDDRGQVEPPVADLTP
jgi:hypothetical protein